jgi:hypothetical protein
VHGAALDIKDINHRLNSEHECTPLRLPRTMAVHGYLSLYVRGENMVAKGEGFWRLLREAA